MRTSMTGSHQSVAIMKVLIPSPLIGDTRGVLFCVAGPTSKTGTTRSSAAGPWAGAGLVFEMSSSGDRGEKRTGKGTNAASGVINETIAIDVIVHSLLQAKEQGGKKDET